jgi:hypothetical protein
LKIKNKEKEAHRLYGQWPTLSFHPCFNFKLNSI